MQINRKSNRALMRLTLRVMGETHRLFIEVQEWLIAQINNSTTDGAVDGVKLLGIMPQLEQRWRTAMQQWTAMFTAAREQAASIPFGALVAQHNAYMGIVARLQEDMTPEEGGIIVQTWQRRRQLALQAMQDRVYSDGLTLSQRIWRLENGGLGQIRNTLASAMNERTSAGELAQQVEAQLGAERDLPRWTATRLYRMEPSDRAVNAKGLLRGPENRGRGVAYNALRLARTELQYAHHAVSTEIARYAPWVTGRKVRLSPGHPKIDICDSYAAGGPYAKDEAILPLHPNCMCYYEDVLMDKADFVRQSKGWVAGENQFFAEYANWLQARQVTEPLSEAMSMADTLELWNSQRSGAQASALRLLN